MTKSFKLFGIVEGRDNICGRLLPISRPISYLGDIDPERGEILKAYSVAGSIVAYPNAVGSTVGSYVLYSLRRHGVSPAALIVEIEDPVTVVGAVISDIPLYKLTNSTVRELQQYKGKNACIEADELVLKA